jgi:methionyl-tRNA formyltransferase
VSAALKLAFFGSPAFALPSLEALLAAGHEVALVVTQPDRPAGRGLKTTSPAVALRARELGLRLEQPQRLRRNEEFRQLLASLGLDVAVTAAYGQILPASLLEVPAEGFLNVHGSLLPAWRGAAPVQWALINGDTETGITIMQTDAGLDSGPVRLQRKLRIGPDETAPELFGRLSLLGARALTEALDLLVAGRLPCVPQDPELVSLAPLLVRSDGAMDWQRPAGESYNRFRGVAAWPGSFFPFRGQDIKVHQLSVHDFAGSAGEVLRVDARGILVSCSEKALLLEILQPPGKPRMPAGAWANGSGIRPGSLLS